MGYWKCCICFPRKAIFYFIWCWGIAFYSETYVTTRTSQKISKEIKWPWEQGQLSESAPVGCSPWAWSSSSSARPTALGGPGCPGSPCACNRWVRWLLSPSGSTVCTGYGAGIAFEPHAAETNMALLPKLGFQKLDAVQPCPTALSLALDWQYPSHLPISFVCGHNPLGFPLQGNKGQTSAPWWLCSTQILSYLGLKCCSKCTLFPVEASKCTLTLGLFACEKFVKF